jgi:hypothetical protein
MSGGTISLNKATGSSGNNGFGGGVNMVSGTFTMSGGIISGNIAGKTGGGVYVGGGTFIKEPDAIQGNSGIIYGKDNTANENTAEVGGSGHAVYYAGASCYRDTTLDTGDTIRTTDPLPTTYGNTENNWTKGS